VVVTYDGVTGEALASSLSLPRVVVFDEVPSTMDIASELAESGAPAGTMVLADAQLAGRGRGGRRWESPRGDGIWLTLLERLNDPDALDVLSLRIGLRVAKALDRFTPGPIGLKWPNDIYLGDSKLGGMLVETRWRGQRPEWTTIGIGINVRHAGHPGGAALGPDVSRLEVLGELVPLVRAATSARGRLTSRELSEYGARDIAAGRSCLEPQVGRVAGIASDGALLIETGYGVKRVVEGSLVLDEP
jgi:BirA family biotin operon repressor/biotin-[acetyl-CoA-carboxylase] ligase